MPQRGLLIWICIALVMTMFLLGAVIRKEVKRCERRRRSALVTLRTTVPLYSDDAGRTWLNVPLSSLSR